MNNDKQHGLLAEQWSHYRDVHKDRKNLIIHVVTAPVFMAGGVLIGLAPFVSAGLALAGVLAMFVAMAAQGRGHRFEDSPPAPFRGPLDVIARIFAEQWITFPRYVLSGELGRALRAR
jgi:hypothetical protein